MRTAVVAAGSAATRKENRSVKTSKLLLLVAVFTLAAIPASAQLSDTYVIAAAANQRGAFGSHWMTRFTLFNPHLDKTLWVSVTFLPTGGEPEPDPDKAKLIELPPNSLAYSDNILEALYDFEGGGSLLVATFPEDNPGVPDDPLARSFLVTTDTYNNAPNGTYGQTIPGVWTGLLDYQFDNYKISAVAPMVRNGGDWRTNIGAVNLGACSVKLLVSVYDGDGNTIIDNAEFPVPPYGHNQLPLFVNVAAGSVEFILDDPCAENDEDYAVVFPYTSMIDRRTNDPTYTVPTLLAPADSLFAKGQTIDPHTIGKKIDIAYARRVRSQAQDLGVAKLTRDTAGWKITR
jgi:hypothetical protein